jgi:hypothetical protein
MVKKLFLSFLLAAALLTGIGAGLGQAGNQGMSIPAAHACPIQDPGCGG